MKRKLLFSVPMLFALVLFVSFNSWAQEPILDETLRDGEVPAGWTDADITWETGAGGYARFTDIDSELWTPILDFTGYTNVQLTFHVAKWGGGDNGPLTIEVSDDGGLTWDAQTFDSPVPTGSDYLISGPTLITAEGDQVMIRWIRPDSPSQKRLRDVILTGDVEGAVATPYFLPNGGTFYAPVDVEISTETDDATIYYSLEGDEGPWVLFDDPITVVETTTIWAYATADGLDDSNVADAVFTFPDVVDVADIAELRDQEQDGTVYRLANEVILTFQTASRNQKFIQDDSGAILIDDAPGNLSTEYDIYDGITGITGTLGEFQNMLQFIPVTDAGDPTSTGIELDPILVTLEDLDQTYEAHLVQVINVDIDPGGDELFENAESYTITDDTGEGTLRTNYFDLDYIGEPIPGVAQNLVGVVHQRFAASRLVPRSLNDFEDYVEPLQPAEPLDLFTWMDKTGENIPAELGTGNNARAAALCMNRYVVVPSREDGNNVWVWDTQNQDDPPVALNPGDGYVSGLFAINYVRAASGHIYVSNMTLGTNNWHPFKVYRWAGIDAEPEVIINLTYDVDDPAMNWGRLGDAFSIIGNPADEGHIIAHVASGGDGNRKFLKWNFVDGVNQNPQDPVIITVDATFNINSYGSFNPIEGEEDLFLVTGNTMGIALVDLDGEVHSYLGTDIIPMRSMDPRVFYYDGKRYLSYVVSNEGDAVSGAYYDVIDISMGNNVLEAFESITTLEDLNLRRAHSFVLGAGNAFYSSTHNVSHTPDGDVVFLTYVLGRGFILESSAELEIEPPIDLPFDLLFNQPYFDGGTAATSALDTEAEIDYEVADNFFGLEDEIEEFVFYGLALKFVDGAWTEQAPGDTEPFFVRFYEYEETEATGLIAPATGEYQIGLLDSFGDGWNGGTVTVYVNDDAVLTGITLLSGAGPEYHDFDAEAGDMIWTVYTAGNWAYENYYAILDPDGNIIAEDGGTWANPGATTPSGIEPGGAAVALEPDWANPVAEFSVDAEVTHVGSVWNGAYQLYKFVAPLEIPVDLEDGWVSTQIDADNGSGTWFLWINSMVGDEQSFQRTEALRTAFSRDIVDLSGISAKGEIHASRDQLDYDMAFELYGGELSDLPLCATNPTPADMAVNVELEGVFSWTGDPIAAGYKIYFGYAGGEWEFADGVDLGDETMVEFEGLEFETAYEWKVVPYNLLGDAEECPVWTFTTMPDPMLSPPLLETFVGTPFPPTNWSRYSGILGEDTDLTPVTGFWLHHWFGNVTGPAGTQNSAFVNIYGTRNHWLVTPEINLGEGGYQVEFDIALTPWTGQAEINLGPDDYVAFVISRDGGETWSDANVLIDWDATDVILPTGNSILLDIADETGIVKFGIYAERPTGFQPDLRFYFTNFQVRTPPDSPIFLISDQEWNFGQVGLMEESQPKEFVISNNGIDVLTVHAPVLENADEFILIYNEDDFPAELEDDDTVSFYAVFAPESVGAKTAQVNIPFNDGEENTAMVTLMGTGFERPAGSTCSNPFVVELPLVDYQDNTEQYGDDYSSTWIVPTSNYLNGNDFVVQFTLDEAAALSGSVAGSWTGLIILADCPNPTNPPQRLALGSGSAGGSFTNLVLEAGTYFAIVSTWPSPQFTDFTLNLSSVPVYTVTFDVTGAFHGYEIDDAIITLNGVTNEPGDYVFTGLLEGTYNYSISRLCYETLTGEVVVDDHVTVEAELDLDLLPGDANGDGVVDVLDLIAIGNYYIGNDPAYFCFHNADINEDGEVDVLDIIGVVNIFSKGRIAPHAGLQSAPASIYLTESGIELYSDGTLAGLQFEITGEMLQGLELKLDLPNHQIIHVYQNGMIRAMIFSMENEAIPAGKISLVSFSNDVEAEWKSVKAGNLNAEEVPVVIHDDEVTSIDEASDIAFSAYPNPASDILWVEFHNIGESSLSLINVQGQVVETQIVYEQGHKQISFNLGNLPAGIYMLRLEHNDATITERILIK